jgi:HD-GYP domain-containing protein (c-di-GMP phosphodiesterase class II)
MSFLFPEFSTSSKGVVINTSSIVIIGLIILSLSGYHITIKDTESLIAKSQELSNKINKINEFALFSALNPIKDKTLHFSQFIDIAVQLTNSATGALLLIDENGMFSYAAISGRLLKNLEGVMVTSKLGIVGFCFNNRKGYFSNNVEEDTIFDLRSDKIGDIEIKNILVVPILKKGEPFGVIQLINKENGEYTDLDLSIITSLTLHFSLVFDQKDSGEGRTSHLNEAAGIISTILEASGLGANHHINTTKYVALMGETMLDNSLEKDDLHLAALLHNVGLVFIEPHLRNNKEIYERHPIIGADLLKKVPAWGNASIYVLHHHENFDGTGYPQGLQGEDIPLPARILAVAEYFDNLTNKSISGQKLSMEEAKYEIINCSGTFFDPRVVEAFAQVSEHFTTID